MRMGGLPPPTPSGYATAPLPLLVTVVSEDQLTETDRQTCGDV